jgi:hypothetical protein
VAAAIGPSRALMAAAAARGTSGRCPDQERFKFIDSATIARAKTTAALNGRDGGPGGAPGPSLGGIECDLAQLAPGKQLAGLWSHQVMAQRKARNIRGVVE